VFASKTRGRQVRERYLAKLDHAVKVIRLRFAEGLRDASRRNSQRDA
jgi:hypothetical protein